MRFYEITVILRPELSKKQIEDEKNEIVSILEAKGGKTSRHEYWGLRTLAYPIEKNNRAHYIFFNAETDGDSLREAERKMRINTKVMRYLSVKVEALDQEPSVMMLAKFREEQKEKQRSEGGDERKGRGERRDQGERSERGENPEKVAS